jgi:hypothetical protein
VVDEFNHYGYFAMSGSVNQALDCRSTSRRPFTATPAPLISWGWG